MHTQSKQILIFDLDGTLYPFKNGSLSGSGLATAIIANTEKYLVEKCGLSETEAVQAMVTIREKYGLRLSVATEELYGANRLEYFSYAWNIPVDSFVTFDRDTFETLTRLKDQYTLVILSDAPRVWVNRVLAALQVVGFFDDAHIFTGETDIRKEHYNAFENVLRTLALEPTQCIAIGDQENTDIIPAKMLGIRTIHIGSKSAVADVSIRTITAIEEALTYLNRE